MHPGRRAERCADSPTGTGGRGANDRSPVRTSRGRLFRPRRRSCQNRHGAITRRAMRSMYRTGASCPSRRARILRDEHLSLLQCQCGLPAVWTAWRNGLFPVCIRLDRSRGGHASRFPRANRGRDRLRKCCRHRGRDWASAGIRTEISAMSLARLICRSIGHKLQTTVHAREPTLWCSRCKTIRWWIHKPSGLILSTDATQADLDRLGIITSDGDDRV